MGLRLTEGVDLRALAARYGTDIHARWGASLEPYEAAGLVVRDERRLRLTRRGMLLSNEIVSVFV
jgi:oxygen-independent coproporphyrinogen-3 oxidase